MNSLTLEKLQQLPPEKQQEVADFVEYLLQKYKSADSMTKEELAAHRMNNFGRLKGQIWMAEDFNETPEDFKDYM